MYLHHVDWFADNACKYCRPAYYMVPRHHTPRLQHSALIWFALQCSKSKQCTEIHTAGGFQLGIFSAGKISAGENFGTPKFWCIGGAEIWGEYSVADTHHPKAICTI